MPCAMDHKVFGEQKAPLLAGPRPAGANIPDRPTDVLRYLIANRQNYCPPGIAILVGPSKISHLPAIWRLWTTGSRAP